MELNATSVSTAPDILSLINLLGDSSIVSTSQSTPFPQDFCALFTELMGPTAGNTCSDDVIQSIDRRYDPVDPMKDAWPQTTPTTSELSPSNPESKTAATQNPVQFVGRALRNLTEPTETPTSSTDPVSDAPVLNAGHTGETQKTSTTENPATNDRTVPANNIVVLLVPFLHFADSPVTFMPAPADSTPVKVDEPATKPVPPQVRQPELERAFADVKRFKLTVQPEVPASSAVPARQQPSVSQDQPSKVAIVTTDSLQNITQQQLPPRVVPVLKKFVQEANPADRSKSSPAPANDLIAPTLTDRVADLVRPIERVERVDQTPVAHTIEIPNVPHLPVVRIVAIQVDEADSEVTVRIRQRGGVLTFQVNADNERLHQNLQSSVGSLAQALKLEHVPSGMEVSRKSLRLT